MRKIREYLSQVLVVLVIATMFSCSKENISTAVMVVKLTDETAAATLKDGEKFQQLDEVNIDIEKVSIHYGDDNLIGFWIDLETNAGIYNLRDLHNNPVILAISSELPSEYITQIRITLGNENSIVDDSAVHELTCTDTKYTELNSNLNVTIQPGTNYEAVLDFDAEKSVIFQDNGEFLLQPVIRLARIRETSP